MFRKLLLPLVLVLALCWPSAPSAHQPKLLDSVRALAWPSEQLNQDENGVVTVTQTGEISNHCTVTSINERKHYWLTAAHCVTDNWPVGNVVDRAYFIGDSAKMVGAVVVVVDVPDDLAIMATPGYGVRALHMQDHDVEFGQHIRIAGHPLGWPDPIYVEGIIANPATLFTDADKPYMLYQTAAAPGNSGSAVVNTHDEIVSVLQVGWSGGAFGSMSGGAPWPRLMQFVHEYVG